MSHGTTFVFPSIRWQLEQFFVDFSIDQTLIFMPPMGSELGLHLYKDLGAVEVTLLLSGVFRE